MKANPRKLHLLVSKRKTFTTVTSDNLRTDINGVKIESRQQQKMLGVIIDDNLTLKNHIYNMLKKSSQMHLQELHPTCTKRKGE